MDILKGKKAMVKIAVKMFLLAKVAKVNEATVADMGGFRTFVFALR